MIIKAKNGDVIELPEKFQFMGLYFDLILLDENGIGFADKLYFKMSNFNINEEDSK